MTIKKMGFLIILAVICVLALVYFLISSPFMALVTATPPPEQNTILFKITSDGKPEWQTTFPGIGDVNTGIGVLETADRGYAVYGDFWLPKETQTSLRILKLNQNGKIEWDVLRKEYLYSPKMTLVRPVILLKSEGGYTIFLQGGVIIRVDSSGNEQWLRNYPRTDIEYVIRTIDGGYAVTGSDVYREIPEKISSERRIGRVANLDRYGNITWERKYRDYTGCDGMALQSNGTLLVECWYSSNNISQIRDDVFALNNQSGEIVWTMTAKQYKSYEILPNSANSLNIPTFFDQTHPAGLAIQLSIKHPNASIKKMVIEDKITHENLTEIYRVYPAGDGGFLVFASVNA